MSLITSQILAIKGETRTLQYQVLENGTPKNISGMTFKFAAKQKIPDTTYIISPVAGTITDAVNGKFSFTITFTTVFAGVYEIAMYDATAQKTILTTPGGAPIRVVEDIID